MNKIFRARQVISGMIIRKDPIKPIDLTRIRGILASQRILAS